MDDFELFSDSGLILGKDLRKQNKAAKGLLFSFSLSIFTYLLSFPYTLSTFTSENR
jgi:hypothetical protein